MGGEEGTGPRGQRQKLAHRCRAQVGEQAEEGRPAEAEDGRLVETEAAAEAEIKTEAAAGAEIKTEAEEGRPAGACSSLSARSDSLVCTAEPRTHLSRRSNDEVD